MEIEKVVEQKFGEIVASGFIEEQVKKHLEQTISSTISDSLRTYSDFGKELGKKITQSLNLGEMKFDLPSYNQLVSNWVLDIVNREIISSGKAQIEANLKAFFVPLEKSEWKISEIIQKFKNGIDDDDNNGGEITFIREKSSMVGRSFVDFYFSKDSETRKRSCDYHIGTKEGQIWRMKVAGDDVDAVKTPLYYGFEAFLFQLFATKANIIDDSDNVDISYGNDYD